jgi:hypothetical protein
MVPSDACAFNSGWLIESSMLYIERRFPPYDSSLDVFILRLSAFPKHEKTGTNLFHRVGRFSCFPVHAFQKFGFGLCPSLKYKRLVIAIEANRNANPSSHTVFLFLSFQQPHSGAA